ncbi:MAG: 5-formyltetrahydrofolate cyclo-ligase, partial [Actinomycetota bacterium]|nr:5-formyltetrahydrofolate cyclo-ligase [Actinomycetota bacterium]
RQGGFGLLEPTGRTLGPEAITDAHRVVVPALAVDRHGTRLGRGAGYYDRALRRVPKGVAILAVVRSEEVYSLVPRETHDVSVDGALTPAGLIRLDAAL